MCVDSDLLALNADLSPNVLRSEPEGDSIVLFEPTLSAQPGLLVNDIIRVQSDSDFEQVPFTLIVDVCDDPELAVSAPWQKALGEGQQAVIVQHTAETIVFHNDFNGASVPTSLHFAHIGNALLLRVERSSSSSRPFDSCKLYLDQGGKEKSLFLSVAQPDLVEVRPGWYVIPMSSTVSSAVAVSAKRLPAFLDEAAALNASKYNISVEFSGQATNVTWQATFYWQHVNLIHYENGMKCAYFCT